MDNASPRPRLLLIEDNPDTRQIYKDVFERDGFEVLQAEDGEKGLTFAQAIIPDVILLDVMLPKLNGFDLLKRLRSQEVTQNIPVMIFSALGDASDRARAAGLGVTEYAVKAVNSPKQVMGRVRNILSNLKDPLSRGTASLALTVCLKESSSDAPRLLSEVNLSNGFVCPQCHSEVVLSMLSDPTRTPGHWFVAHLVCHTC